MIRLPDSQTRQQVDAVSVQAVGARSWYVVAVLTAIYACHLVDRQLITIVLEPIKTSFGLSDTELGFLVGTCYAISFGIAGIPLGMLVDRLNRRNFLALAVVLWSSATVLTGFSNSYMMLVAARIALAVFEAPAQPASVSMMADIFPSHRRGTALGIYGTSLGIAQLVGYVCGGYLEALWGWRAVFFIAGAPGLLLAWLLLKTVPEPARRTADHRLASETKAPPLRDTLRFMLSQPALMGIYVSYLCMTLAMAGTSAFLPSFFVRIHGLSLAQVGLFMGITLGLCTTIGSVLGGSIADRISRHDTSVIPRLTAIAAAVMMVAGMAMVTVSSVAGAIGFMMLWSAAFMAQVGPNIGLTQSLVGTRMRGTATATLHMIVNLVAHGIGVPLIGLLSDTFKPWAGTSAIRYALVLIAAINVVAIVLQLVIVRRRLKADLACAASV